MTDEAAFLEAIRAAPHDLAPRLVYADWLDDHSDPRGELIRVEEEMRTLPAFADRYWELKPRRNELRQRADADWRAAFGDGTVARPLFGHGIPGDWKGRWRLIREFVERWHGIPMGDIGGHADEVRAVEERLGRTLPPAVREWVAFAEEFREDPGTSRSSCGMCIPSNRWPPGRRSHCCSRPKVTATAGWCGMTSCVNRTRRCTSTTRWMTQYRCGTPFPGPSLRPTP